MYYKRRANNGASQRPLESSFRHLVKIVLAVDNPVGVLEDPECGVLGSGEASKRWRIFDERYPSIVCPEVAVGADDAAEFTRGKGGQAGIGLEGGA